jgi:probable HAF family extracellular repeat protein
MVAVPAFKIRVFVLAAILSMALGYLSPAYAATVGVRAYLIDLNTKEATPLENFGGSWDIPFAINEAGQVAGASRTPPPSQFHAFVTGSNASGIIDLGPGEAHGINDAGQVVGRTKTDQPFITGPNGSGITLLDALAASADGINNSGQVVGTLFTSSGENHAFITGPNGAGITDLGTMGGISSSANGINDEGQVVGGYETGERLFHAFVTGPDGVGMTDLGTLTGISSSAVAINSAGQIVGTFLTAEHQPHAFFAGPNGEGITDLGTLGGISSAALGINDAGQVVGAFHASSAENHGAGENHAFITGPNGVGMTDLNLLIPHPGPVFLWTQAHDINNHGQVIVEASIVPEPETYALMLAGLALIGIIAVPRKATVAPMETCSGLP